MMDVRETRRSAIVIYHIIHIHICIYLLRRHHTLHLDLRYVNINPKYNIYIINIYIGIIYIFIL